MSLALQSVFPKMGAIYFSTDPASPASLQAELTHISAGYIALAAAFMVFVLDSIMKENFMELVVAAFLSILVVVRLLFWLVSRVREW